MFVYMTCRRCKLSTAFIECKRFNQFNFIVAFVKLQTLNFDRLVWKMRSFIGIYLLFMFYCGSDWAAVVKIPGPEHDRYTLNVQGFFSVSSNIGVGIDLLTLRARTRVKIVHVDWKYREELIKDLMGTLRPLVSLVMVAIRWNKFWYFASSVRPIAIAGKESVAAPRKQLIEMITPNRSFRRVRLFQQCSDERTQLPRAIPSHGISGTAEYMERNRRKISVNRLFPRSVLALSTARTLPFFIIGGQAGPSGMPSHGMPSQIYLANLRNEIL